MTFCPSCNSTQLRPFYAVKQIPCHSVLLMESHVQAVGYPRADLQLAFCEKCGFIMNTMFDANRNEYSQSYEETQHFSTRFNSFATELATDLIERHDIRRKRILEIGCGKGEFLGLLCEQGDNHGIGIDPSCRPERLPPHWRSRIEVVNALYSREHAQFAADVIVCRHTLEHIGPTKEFLETVRDSVGDRQETVLFFEVPDIRIILKECRFWDVYYEHCSYFSLGSLARLFRACRFEIVRLERAFDDQYALIVARPSGAITEARFPQEDDIEDLNDLVNTFEREAVDVVRGWQTQVREWHAGGRRIAIWGAGSKCVAFLTTTGLSQEIATVVDINPHKQGRYLPTTGHHVCRPEELRTLQPDLVLLMNSIYRDEVQRQLDAMGVQVDVIAV